MYVCLYEYKILSLCMYVCTNVCTECFLFSCVYIIIYSMYVWQAAFNNFHLLFVLDSSDLLQVIRGVYCMYVCMYVCVGLYYLSVVYM